MMRMVCFVLLASILAAPGLALAETARHESDAHEVAEHEASHDAHDGHGELTFRGLLSSPDFQGTLVNVGALLLLFAWIMRKKGNPAVSSVRRAPQASGEG